MKSSRVLAALPLALLFAAAPVRADPQQHVQAAKKAERRGDWTRALQAWKAAYSEDVNAEYLIGIGDSYAHLGNKAEAKKNYDAYLSDPLSLPANADKVKAKVASLDSAPGLDLPGAGSGLALPAAGGGLDLPGAALSAAPALQGLGDLPLPAAPADSKKGRKGRKGSDTPALPGLDLPGPGAEVSKVAEAGLGLPNLDLPAGPSKKSATPEKKIAAANPGLGPDLLSLPSAEPVRTTPTASPAVATKTPPATRTSTATPPAQKPPPARVGKEIASASTTGNVHTTTAQPERKPLPDAAVAEAPAPRSSPTVSGGRSNAIAYVTAGVALVALGGGAFAYTRAGAAHTDLTGSVHDGATSQRLLEDERRNRTVSFVGLAGGLVAAGIATALFAF